MKFDLELLESIDEYQVNHFLPFRSGAILELIRLGLMHANNPLNIIKRKSYGEKGDSLLLSLSYPVPLLDQIDNYKQNKSLTTRASAINELIQIGLQNPLEASEA